MSDFKPPVPPPPPPPPAAGPYIPPLAPTYVAPPVAYQHAGGYQVQANQMAPVMNPVSPWGRLGSYLLEGLLVTVTLGIGWLIWAAMTGGNGQTPAKRLLKIRVINASTLRPAGLAKMFFVRGILAGFVAQLAIVCTIGILLFMPFWDKRNQNLWDKVSNTYVVHDPYDQWATKPDLR
jgi:uncharacterized RDD family membrane protein YckC